LQYLVWHLTHRGAVWASGAAQAAQVVRIILQFCGERLSLRRGFDIGLKNPFFNSKKKRARRERSTHVLRVVQQHIIGRVQPDAIDATLS
jgi:hypothetical protein